jgi:hypothetical protein
MNVMTEIDGKPIMVHIFSSYEGKNKDKEVTHVLVNPVTPEQSKSFIAGKTDGKDAVVVHKCSVELSPLLEALKVPEVENIQHFMFNVQLATDRFVKDKKDKTALKKIIKKYT